MDSSSLFSIMKGVGGCVVDYEFTRVASTIITGIAKVVRAAVGKKRWIFKGIFAAVRGHKDRIIFFNDIIKTW